jgi:hypothetical protein
MRLTGFALALALGLALSGAAKADPNIGCGWGTQLFAGKNTIIFQALGATTNAFLGNQTFGISSNTIGCKGNQTITAEYRLNMFAGSNFDRLAREMATGEGEALESLAVLLEIEETDRASFYQLAQSEWLEIFPTGELTAGEMLENLDRAMGADTTLSRYARG